jgi:hypothetical protein
LQASSDDAIDPLWQVGSATEMKRILNRLYWWVDSQTRTGVACRIHGSLESARIGHDNGSGLSDGE